MGGVGSGAKGSKGTVAMGGLCGLDYLGPVAWVAVEVHKYRMGTRDEGGERGELVW